MAGIDQDALHARLEGKPRTTDAVRRARLARDVLHDRDGALAYERDGYSVGADAVAGDAESGVGGVEERGGNRMIRERSIAAAVLLLPVLLIITDALGFNEPDGFRGLPWGATEQQMRSSPNTARG